MSARASLSARRYDPHQELASRIESIVTVQAAEATERTLPPSTGTMLVFRIHGDMAEQAAGRQRLIPRSALTGVNFLPRTIHYQEGTELLLVRFREGGADGLFTAPMDQLAGGTRPLDSVMDERTVAEIEGRLAECTSDAARIEALECTLMSRTPGFQEDALVTEAIRRIRGSRGTIRMAELVKALATNPDTLEKRFRRRVGVPPKLFSRIVRFQGFVDGYSAGTDLTAAAVQAGYYDHAHLAREFQLFTGQSPRAFLLQSRSW